MTVTLPTGIGLSLFNINSNKFEGPISSRIESLTAMKYFDISFNSINGIISSEIGKLSKLSYFAMFFNNFVGSIPSSIGCLTGCLTEWTLFYIMNNCLSGSIPSVLNSRVMSVYYQPSLHCSIRHWHLQPNKVTLSFAI
jgi:hypothetical protein